MGNYDVAVNGKARRGIEKIRAEGRSVFPSIEVTKENESGESGNKLRNKYEK